MREWCGCGAAVRGRRRDVLAWRDDHHHDSTSAPSERLAVAFTHVENAAPFPVGFVPEES